jgi:hypothetical protein
MNEHMESSSIISTSPKTVLRCARYRFMATDVEETVILGEDSVSITSQNSLISGTMTIFVADGQIDLSLDWIVADADRDDFGLTVTKFAEAILESLRIQMNKFILFFSTNKFQFSEFSKSEINFIINKKLNEFDLIENNPKIKFNEYFENIIS